MVNPNPSTIMNFQAVIRLAAFSLSISFTVSAVAADKAKDDAMDYQAQAEDLEIRAQLKQKIMLLTRDEQARKKLIRDARRRISLCKACHGEDGNAVVENVPSLAGQNPVYLVDQFMRFADGRRHDKTMSSLARAIKDEDKIKLAIYFSAQKMRPSGGGQQELMARGKNRYQFLCAECHAEDGRGAEQGYARLAGQRPEYIVKMLKEFKNQTGRRSNPWMTARANSLSESDMQAVATYLANMQ